MKNKYGDFPQLAKEGFYIRRTKGTYKGQRLTEYSVVKDLSEGHRTVHCLINRKAAFIIRNAGIMPQVNAEQEAVWLNKPDCLNFTTSNNKAPLKITFHN